MKTRKQFLTSVFVMSILAIGLFGCDKNEDHLKDQPGRIIADCVKTVILNIEVPDNIVAGQPANFQITFMKPTPCYTFEGFQLAINRYTLQLDVCLSKPDPELVCIQVIDIEKQQLTQTFSNSGTYTLKYKGVDGTEYIEFEVL